MKYSLNGLSIADTRNPVETHAQSGGTGIVYNKALAIPIHIGKPWNSIEFVSIPPGKNGVGKHTQSTDEIYLIVEGTGELVTNGSASIVTPGLLVIAPKGTTHEISNSSDEKPLSFLVVELLVPDGAVASPPDFRDLYEGLWESEGFYPVYIGKRRVQPLVKTVDLSLYFTSNWGMLSLVCLPPGASVEEYVEREYDQLIFTVLGFPTFYITESQESDEKIRVDGDGTYHQSVVIPRGVPRKITNRASGNHPLVIACLNVRRTEALEVVQLPVATGSAMQLGAI